KRYDHQYTTTGYLAGFACRGGKSPLECDRIGGPGGDRASIRTHCPLGVACCDLLLFKMGNTRPPASFIPHPCSLLPDIQQNAIDDHREHEDAGEGPMATYGEPQRGTAEDRHLQHQP